MTFRVGSIPVEVQLGFFAVATLLGYRDDAWAVAIWVLVCFVSVLVHELGHALMIARFGGTPSVLLYPGGGLTYGDTTDRPGRSMLVSLAGPGAGFVVAGVVFALARLHPPQGLAALAYRDLIWVNLGWGLFNLVPMLPLDGGNTFESLLALRWPTQARFVTEVVSALTCLVLVALAARAQQLILAAMVLYWGGPVFTQLRTRLDAHRDRRVISRFEELCTLRHQGQTDQAIRLGQELLAEARSAGCRRALASELALNHRDRRAPAATIEALLEAHFFGVKVPLALALTRQVARDGAARSIDRLEQEARDNPSLEVLGLFLDACAELDQRERGVSLAAALPDGHLAHLALSMKAAVHFHQQRYLWSLTVCEMGVEALDEPVFAFNAACCLAHLGRPDEAFVALERAFRVDRGQDASILDTDTDLAALRRDPRWPGVRAALLALRP